MLQFRLPLTALLTAACIAVSPLSSAAQQSDKNEAFIAFSVDVEQLLNSKLVKAFGEEFPTMLAMDEESAAVMTGMKKIHGFVAAPEGEFNPWTMTTTDFYVKLTMNNKAVVDKMERELDFGFRAIERDGKEYYEAEGAEAPPIFARREGNSLSFASKGYMFAKDRDFASADLTKLLKSTEGKPYRIAIHFDGARKFLDGAADMARENADFMTKPYVGLLDELSTMTLSMDPDADTMLSIKMTGHNEKENEKIKQKMDAAVGLLLGVAQLGLKDMARESEEAADLAEAFLGGIKVKGTAEDITVKVNKPENFETMLASAVKSAKRAAEQVKDLNKMKQVGLSMHNYYDTHRKFPFNQAILKSDLSWRVPVLPYLDELPLYDRFDLDEGWDSKDNLELTNDMPDVFKTAKGVICYIKPEKPPTGFRDILDGTSNTIVFIENPKAQMMPWTKPASVTPKEVADLFANLKDGDKLIVAFYDGSVRRMGNEVPRKTIIALCTPAGGEVANLR